MRPGAREHTTGAVATNARLWDPGRPLHLDGRAVRFAFEAEFLPDERIAEKLDKYKIRVRPGVFPFLSREGNIEADYSGNWEVKSDGVKQPVETIEKIAAQMKEIKDFFRVALGSQETKLKGFHLHIFFAKSVIAQHSNEEQLKGWISRIGDAILFWRLQYRDTTTLTQRRPRAECLGENVRGTVRLLTNRAGADGLYDLELRGFMSSRAQLGLFARIVCTALHRMCTGEAAFDGFYEFQRASTTPPQDDCAALISAIEEATGGVRLVEWKRQLIRRNLCSHGIAGDENRADLRSRMHVMLYHYAHAPYLGSVTQQLIRNATKAHLAQFSETELTLKDYWACCKEWAVGLDLYHTLLTSLLPNYARSFGAEFEMVFDRKKMPHWAPADAAAGKIALLELRRQLATELRTNVAGLAVHVVTRTKQDKRFFTWQLEDDSSLYGPAGRPNPDPCAELIMPITPLDGELREVVEVLRVAATWPHLRDNMGELSARASMHMHMGLERVSFEQLRTVCCNYVAIERGLELLFPKHRRDNKTYCASHCNHLESDVPACNQGVRSAVAYLAAAKDVVDLVQRMNPIFKGRNTSDAEHDRRYHRVNLMNLVATKAPKCTMEFRLHEATLAATDVRWLATLLLGLLEAPAREWSAAPLTALAEFLSGPYFLRHDSRFVSDTTERMRRYAPGSLEALVRELSGLVGSASPSPAPGVGEWTPALRRHRISLAPTKLARARWRVSDVAPGSRHC